jgi:hypothetical protein
MPCFTWPNRLAGIPGRGGESLAVHSEEAALFRLFLGLLLLLLLLLLEYRPRNHLLIEVR